MGWYITICTPKKSKVRPPPKIKDVGVLQRHPYVCAYIVFEGKARLHNPLLEFWIIQVLAAVIVHVTEQPVAEKQAYLRFNLLHLQFQLYADMVITHLHTKVYQLARYTHARTCLCWDKSRRDGWAGINSTLPVRFVVKLCASVAMMLSRHWYGFIF